MLLAAAMLLIPACSHLEKPNNQIIAPPTVGQKKAISPSDLVGVWEVVAYRDLVLRKSGKADKKPNFKYCFDLKHAYPELSPDAKNDSADGGGDYHITGENTLVIRTGVPGGIWTYEIESVAPDKLVWRNGSLQTTLRRIAKKWNSERPIAPMIRRKEIPVK
jgi:hypothetical protein